jgi:hypothetical protein
VRTSSTTRSGFSLSHHELLGAIQSASLHGNGDDCQLASTAKKLGALLLRICFLQFAALDSALGRASRFLAPQSPEISGQCPTGPRPASSGQVGPRPTSSKSTGSVPRHLLLRSSQFARTCPSRGGFAVSDKRKQFTTIFAKLRSYGVTSETRTTASFIESQSFVLDGT